jgi:hypothetical protein
MKKHQRIIPMILLFLSLCLSAIHVNSLASPNGGGTDLNRQLNIAFVTGNAMKVSAK